MPLNENVRTAVIFTDNPEAIALLRNGIYKGYSVIDVVLVLGGISNEDLGKHVSRPNDGGAYEMIQSVLLFGGNVIPQAQIDILQGLQIPVEKIDFPNSELAY